MKDVVWIRDDVESSPSVGLILRMYVVILGITALIALPVFTVMWMMGLYGA